MVAGIQAVPVGWGGSDGADLVGPADQEEAMPCDHCLENNSVIQHLGGKDIHSFYCCIGCNGLEGPADRSMDETLQTPQCPTTVHGAEIVPCGPAAWDNYHHSGVPHFFHHS